MNLYDNYLKKLDQKNKEIIKYHTNPKHQDRPTKKVNLTDVLLFASFTIIFLIPFINALIKTNF